MQVKIIVLILFSINMAIDARGAENADKLFYNLATEIKKAVAEQDTNRLLTYVAPSGTYFIDSVYSYDEIKDVIGKKDSWLYKYLFTDRNSVKSYFQSAEEMKIKVHHRNENAVLISYQSSNYDPNRWVECCFIKLKDKWYFDGIFYCK